MTTRTSGRYALLLGLVVLMPGLQQGWAQRRDAVSGPLPPPRYPAGVYAVVPMETVVADLQTKVLGSFTVTLTPAELDAALVDFYTNLLDNAAVSGLALQVYWDTLNHSGPTDYSQWNYLDDAFSSVSKWNSAHSGPPKTIQLQLMPGLNSPPWELSKLATCDFLFDHSLTPTYPTRDCGKATFHDITEPHLGNELPMPWNATYKADWQTFLTALNAKYGSNPSLVSIAVAGPTAASVEIDLPHETADVAMWETLLTNAEKVTDDSAFVTEWKAAIDMYGEVFTGLTLVVTTADGLPNLYPTVGIKMLFGKDCENPTPDCAAESHILTYFMGSTVGGYNGKATQTSGLKGSRNNKNGKLNMGMDGVRTLTANTVSTFSSSTLILGGGQFTTSFSNNPVQEGCAVDFPPHGVTAGEAKVSDIPPECFSPAYLAGTLPKLPAGKLFTDVPPADLISPEQAAYNVLSLFFDRTPAGLTFGGSGGMAPLNYLQIYYPDILYATNYASSSAVVTQTGGTTAETAQALLTLASAQLSLIAVGEPICPKGTVCSH